MQQEIFGPILPILRYSSNEEALAIVHKNPTPLTLYMFSQKQEFIEFMYSRFPSGAMVVGDCIV
jgi:aldehyde dehydrogenase (NAD+)